MPALPDADRVAKIEILGQLATNPCVNVLHAHKTSAIAPGDMATLATATKNAWATNMLAVQSPQYTLNSVRCTDLTSISGEQASASSGAAGTNGTQIAAASAALVVTVKTAVRARSARGRVYVGGLRADSFLDASHYSAGGTSALVTAFQAVITAIIAAGGAGTWTFGVLSYYHKTAGGIPPYLRATPVFTPYTTIIADNHIDSQRRRLGR